MLVLTQKAGEQILIGDNIKIVVASIDGYQVRIGVEAPNDMSIHRPEVLDRIKRGIDESSATT